jgi:hypothetical protein
LIAWLLGPAPGTIVMPVGSSLIGWRRRGWLLIRWFRPSGHPVPIGERLGPVGPSVVGPVLSRPRLRIIVRSGLPRGRTTVPAIAGALIELPSAAIPAYLVGIPFFRVPARAVARRARLRLIPRRSAALAVPTRIWSAVAIGGFIRARRCAHRDRGRASHPNDHFDAFHILRTGRFNTCSKTMTSPRLQALQDLIHPCVGANLRLAYPRSAVDARPACNLYPSWQGATPRDEASVSS